METLHFDELKDYVGKQVLWNDEIYGLKEVKLCHNKDKGYFFICFDFLRGRYCHRFYNEYNLQGKLFKK